ncbi:MAG: peptidylprolyl isomerase [Methanomassiliicoccales archaeon]|nr:MAG: peptidylprolyl isomerase [Methanomassiliicoccales archaeon]
MSKKGLLTIFLIFMFFSIVIKPALAEHGEEEEEQELPSENGIAVLETDYGVITFELYENWTPITTQNFIELAESGHYNGVLFHRIVDDFVIQTGDGGGSDTIPLEIHPNATHVDGAVGMARSEDPDSAEDQFYICDGPQHGLDGDYAVFGIVIEGMEVVREIAEVPVYGENNPRPGSVVPTIWRNVGMPKEDVYLQKVTVNTTDMNETEEIDENSAVSGSGASPWIIGLVAVPVIIAVFFVLTRRKG